MKISDNSINVGQQAYIREIDATKSPDQLNTETQKTDSTSAPVEDKVSLSANARDIQVAKKAVEAAPEVREEVVQDVKKDVEAGTYQVDSEKIADKIVGSNIDELV